jgi:peptidoglycan hydrolase-like protein with peptidoglycan-binding domain
MSNIKKKIVAVVTGLTLVVMMAPGLAQGATAEELQAQINQLLAQLQQLQSQLAALQGTTPTVTGCTITSFARNLKQGMTGDDVKCLQIILNSDAATKVAETGAGSPGNETTYFGAKTKAAVIKFQEKYAADVLTPIGLTAGTGFVGPKTIAKLNSLLTAAPPVQPPTEVVPTQPTASLAPDTPAAATLPYSSVKVPLLKVVLQAAGEEAKITGMTFKRTGLGEADDWATLYLYEGDLRITAIGRTISVDTQEVEFPGLNVVIPAGGKKEITLRADVGDSGVAQAGNQSAFQLVKIESNVTFTGLPVTGNLMTIGGVGVSAVTISAGISPANPVVGTEGAEIGSFRITAGNTDVELKQVILTVSGTMARAGVTNIKLYSGDELLAKASGVDAYDQVTLTLATPYTIAKTLTKIFTVKADLAGRVEETLSVSIAENGDVLVVDKVYGTGAGVTGAAVTAGSITLQGGTLTLADLGPLAGFVAKNSQDVVLTKVGLTASRDVEVLRLSVDLWASDDIFDGTAATISDLRIKDADTGATLMTYTIPAAWGANPDAVTLTGSILLKANVKRNLAITVDVGTATALDNQTIKADLAMVTGPGTGEVYVRDVATRDYLKAADVVPASVSGELQTITAAQLTTALASTPISQTVIRGAEDVEAIGVMLNAAKANDVNVRKIQARVYVNTASNFGLGTEVTTPNAVITAIKLYDGSTLLSQKVLTNVSDTGHDYGVATFDNLNITVAKGTTKTLLIKVNTVKDLAATRYASVAVLGGGIEAYAEGSLLTVTTNVNALTPGTTPARYVTIETAGTFDVVADPTPILSAIVPVGTTGASDVALTEVEVSTAKEGFTITEITVTRAGTAADTAYGLVKIYDGATKVAEKEFAAGATTITFTDLSISVPKDGKKTLAFKADIKGIDLGVTSGETVQINLAAGSFKAMGVSSGALVTNEPTLTITGNAMTVRKSVPTVTLSATQPTTLTGGAKNDVLRLDVKADSKGDVKILSLAIVPTMTNPVTGGDGIWVYLPDGSSVSILNQNSTGLAASNSACDADTITVASGDGAKFQVGERINITGFSECTTAPSNNLGRVITAISGDVLTLDTALDGEGTNSGTLTITAAGYTSGNTYTISGINYTIGAGGTTATFLVKADTTGLTASTDRYWTKIDADTSAGTTGNFVWDDTTGANINGYLVKELPITGPTLKP